MLYAQHRVTELVVLASEITQGTHILSVNQSVLSMQNVLDIWLVSTNTVWTLVQVSVATMPLVMSQTILLNAHVIQDILVMLS